jgi:UDP-N-acetylmuramoyl-tripeptide--D-alanyl-D-alanine ligase
VAATGIDVLIGVGDVAEDLAEGAGGAAGGRAGVSVITVPDAAAAMGYLVGEVRFGDAVLVKASRAVGLEVVVDALVAAALVRGASA